MRANESHPEGATTPREPTRGTAWQADSLRTEGAGEGAGKGTGPSRSTVDRYDGTRAAFGRHDDEMLPIGGGGAVIWPVVLAVICGLCAGLSAVAGWVGFGIAAGVCCIVAVAAALIGGDV